MRRTEISMYVHYDKSQEIASMVAEILARKYGWDEAKTTQEIQSYVDYAKAWVWF